MRSNPLRRSKETSMKVKKELHTITQQLKKHKSQDTYTNQRSVHKDIPNKYILTEKSPTLSKEYIPQNKINMNMNINISPRLVSPNKQPSSTTTPRTSPHVTTTTHMNTHTHNAHVKLGSLDKIMSDNESCQEIDSDETEKSNNNIHNSNSSIIDETEISEMNCELYPTNNVINSTNSTNNDKCQCHINKFPTLSSNPFTESKHNNTLPKPAIVTVNLDDNDYTTITTNNTNTNPNEQLDTLLRSMLVIAKKGDKESLLDLLEKILHYPHCDLNFKDENGFTALHYACDEGNFKIADILIKSNCDVNAKTTTNKKTPLHLTAQRGFFDISKLLIENGAIVNIGDNEKNTPLHLCAMGGHVELMKFFLDKLPQADVKNIYGRTPKDVAMKAEIKELLKEYLDKKDNVYRNIKIHTTSESTLNYMMKKFHSGTQKSNNVMVHNTHNHININIQTNYNNNNNSNNCVHDVSKNNSVDNTTTTATTSGKAVSKRTTLPNTSATKLRYIKQTNTNVNGNGNGGTLPLSVSSSNSVSKKHIPLPNTNTNANTAISKKNSISNFSMNSQLTNRKITPNPQKQNLHKTRTLQKFVSSNHSTTTTNGVAVSSKKECSSLSSSKKQVHPKPNNSNTNTSTSMNPKFNISVDINDPLYRLNKTEELSKPFKTNPNDITTTNDNYNDDDDTNNNNNTTTTKYNHQVSLGSIEEERITLTSFICLAMLGRGSFGEVYLVQKTSSKVLYAMKVLSKDRIMGQNLMKYAMAERNVLSLTNHPFIVKLNFAFQTNHKLFLILDYCAGGDLAKHLQYEKRFTEERARFYLCEIILALEDLHKRDIIFRDLKPDNVVLDNEGHAKLTDFGLSKEGVFDSQCAKSFCGSIAYLAPEMLKKQGHGKAVDWYLLGVLFYEMLVGIPPFFTEQKEEIFRNIEHGELIIPKKVSKEAATLLRGLLQKDPNKRLGSVKDAYEVKEHKYFKKVNWDDVYHKRIPTPKMRNYAKHLQMYNHPRMFQADEQDYSNVDTVLPGWSFINNDDI